MASQARVVVVGNDPDILQLIGQVAQPLGYLTLHVVATDVWASAVHLVPRGAVVWSGGLALGVHL